jgi:hypothetical protein
MTDITNTITVSPADEIQQTSLLPKKQPLKPHQISWSINQRKRRRNARREFAAGNKKAFS